LTTVMTSRDLHIALKRDDGIAYLMDRFNFSEESELFDAIRKVSPSNAENFIKKLEKKQKQFNKRVKNNNATSESDNEADVQPDESPDEETESNEESTPEIPTLEQLLDQERELSSIICKVEGEHKDLVAKRRALVAKLEKYMRALGELQRILKVQEDNVTQTYEAYLDCAAQMEAMNGEKKMYAKQLDNIRQKIHEMRKINIFVYENASFEVENIPVEPIADSEITSQSMKLFALSEAEELTAKEIKNLAKLLLVVKMVEANGYKAELEFDSERVQKFWETVIFA